MFIFIQFSLYNTQFINDTVGLMVIQQTNAMLKTKLINVQRNTWSSLANASPKYYISKTHGCNQMKIVLRLFVYTQWAIKRQESHNTPHTHSLVLQCAC